MDTAPQPTHQPKASIRPGLLIAAFVGLPLVVAIVFSLLVPLHVGKAGVAMVALTFAVVGLRRQKQLSLSAVLLLSLSSILFLASSAIDYAYNITVRPLPTSVEIEVQRVVDIQDLSRGLMLVGLGIGSLLPVWMWRKPDQNSPTRNLVWHGLRWFWLGVAGIYFILAALSLADGFQGV